MSEHIMEKLTIRPLNDVSEKLSERSYEYEVRVGTLSALTERCNRLESENASLRGAVQGLGELCDKYNAENAKLRESVRNLLTCVKHEECEESCPNYEPTYTDYGYERNGSTVVESEYLGCCTVGLENCNSTLFDTDEYLRELGIEVGR